jgi:hypothetical protein
MWIYNVVVLGFLPVEKFPDLMKGEMSLIVSHPYEGRNEFDRFPPL